METTGFDKEERSYPSPSGDQGQLFTKKITLDPAKSSTALKKISDQPKFPKNYYHSVKNPGLVDFFHDTILRKVEHLPLAID